MDINRILISSLALLLGIIASAYFLIWWWRHRSCPSSKSLLLWAAALFLFYWFQIPAILVSFGKVVTVTDFNVFFALTFPITFLALMLVYLGLRQISGGGRLRGRRENDMRAASKIFFCAWFALAVLFFGYYFITQKGIINSYALPLIGNIAFYLPIRALIILVTARLLFRPEFKTIYGALGGAGIIGESVLGILRNLFVVKTVLSYPPEFWYIAMTSSRFFLSTQAISVILLALGFYFLHKTKHRL